MTIFESVDFTSKPRPFRPAFRSTSSRIAFPMRKIYLGYLFFTLLYQTITGQSSSQILAAANWIRLTVVFGVLSRKLSNCAQSVWISTPADVGICETKKYKKRRKSTTRGSGTDGCARIRQCKIGNEFHVFFGYGLEMEKPLWEHVGTRVRNVNKNVVAKWVVVFLFQIIGIA